MKSTKSLAVIHQIKDIPTFADEAEEHAFWAGHQLSDELWKQAEPLKPDELPPPRASTIVRRKLRTVRSTRERSFRAAIDQALSLADYVEDVITQAMPSDVEWNDFPKVTVLKFAHWGAVEYRAALTLLGDAALAPAAGQHLVPLLDLSAQLGWIRDGENQGTQFCRAVCVELGVTKSARRIVQKMSLVEAQHDLWQAMDLELAKRDVSLATLNQTERCACQPGVEGESVNPGLSRPWLDGFWPARSTIALRIAFGWSLAGREPWTAESPSDSFDQRAVLFDQLLAGLASLTTVVLEFANPGEIPNLKRKVEILKHNRALQGAWNVNPARRSRDDAPTV